MTLPSSILVVVLCVAVLLPASSLGNTYDMDVELHRIEIGSFPLVDLSFTMIDPTARSAVRMDTRSFSVYENLRSARVERVSLDETPLSVVLLLDRSGSMFDALEFLRLASLRFVELLEPQDEIMVIDFSDAPNILTPFTNDRERIAASLRTMRAWGPTALYDSMIRSVLEVKDRPGRRVVVAFTDGVDQNEDRSAPLSRHSLETVIERAQEAGVAIHTVGLGGFVARAELTKVARETGGIAMFAPTAHQLGSLYEAVARNLKSRVVLTYRSPETRHDGEWRQVVLRCLPRGGAPGRAEASYRAPGRYVFEIEGQGYDAGNLDALERAEPKVLIRDVHLQELRQGGPGDLSRWLDTYFVRPPLVPAP